MTFRSPVTRHGLVSLTPHFIPQPIPFNLSEIPNTETSCKDTDTEAEGIPNTGIRFGLTLNSQRRRAKQDASIAMYSLQPAAEEFRKIHKPKIPKLKGRYSANAMLVFKLLVKGC